MHISSFITNCESKNALVDTKQVRIQMEILEINEYKNKNIPDKIFFLHR